MESVEPFSNSGAEGISTSLYGLNETGNLVKKQAADSDEAELFSDSGAASPGLQNNKKVVIVLCAGHDSTHSGAQTSLFSEEVLNYKIVQYCKQELEKYNDVIVYTDRDSVDCKYPGQSSKYCLHQRVYDAAALHANTFIDFHLNIGGINGVEVYYPNISYNASIHMEGELLATTIANKIAELGLVNRGAKIRDCTTNDRDEYGNLADYYTSISLSKSLGMTGLIIEHAYLDGYYDAIKLQSEAFLQQLGIADAAAIAQTYKLTKGNETGSMHIIDIAENQWYYNDLKYVYDNDLMTGLTSTRFGPSEILCRAQFATIIYRMEGTPDVTYSDRYSDVIEQQYYSSPVLWASQEDIGILTGYENGQFGPGDVLTREQMVTILFRYMKYLELDTSARADLNLYPDADDITGFACEAMQWAVAKGLIQGNQGQLLPQGAANRAECAALVTRFVKVMENEAKLNTRMGKSK